jgi:hypothetical protein
LLTPRQPDHRMSIIQFVDALLSGALGIGFILGFLTLLFSS